MGAIRLLRPRPEPRAVTTRVQVMDTTLRDGEQTPGVSYTPSQKLAIAEALLSAGVDAIEVGSAKVSEGESEAMRSIVRWAAARGLEGCVEALGFIDDTVSVDWIANNGGKVINLLAKGSRRHCRTQLKKSQAQHLDDIRRTAEYARQKGLDVQVYFEDWSRGMNEPVYVKRMLRGMAGCGVKRVMLCDTLGVLSPTLAESYVQQMRNECKGMSFDFHGHNDYAHGVVNSMFAIKGGATRIHTTVNGLGERAGNADLASFVVAARDLYGIETNMKEKSLESLSELVARMSGIEPAANAPIVGRSIWTQSCGVHAHGDRAGNLYRGRLHPRRFGSRDFSYGLGKTAGGSSIDANCQELGIDITPEVRSVVLAKIKELGDQGVTVTQADLVMLVSDALGEKPNGIELLDYSFTLRKGERPSASLVIGIHDNRYEVQGRGDGQYDAFMHALRKAYPDVPHLKDYHIGISRRGTSGALTEASITWELDRRVFTTRAVDSDQLVAAMTATMRMINTVEASRRLIYKAA